MNLVEKIWFLLEEFCNANEILAEHGIQFVMLWAKCSIYLLQ